MGDVGERGCDHGALRSFWYDSDSSSTPSLLKMSSLETLISTRGGSDTIAVAFVGDSVASQIAYSWSCYLARFALNVTVEFIPFHTVPLYDRQIKEYLEWKLSGMDIAVFSFGLWYTADRFLGSSWNSKEHAAKCFNKTKNEILLETYRFDSKSAMDPEDLGLTRRICPGLLGLDSYEEDVDRLLRVLEQDSNKKSSALPPAIWKDVTPQHFACETSGMFRIPNDVAMTMMVAEPAETAMALISGTCIRNTTCGPIANETLAYSRNAIVDAALARHPKATAAVARTWPQDVRAWDFHPVRDCTHFCLNSTTARGWAEAITSAVGSILGVRG